MLGTDSDFDGLSNNEESAAGTNPNSDDSDGDGVLDGSERRWWRDTDLDGKINALDKDSDNDGLADGVEDADKDGKWDVGVETDGLAQDTDGDFVQDGTEQGLTTAEVTDHTTGCFITPSCPGRWQFKQDEDDTTTTSALDDDTDDDGLIDGTEDFDQNGKLDGVPDFTSSAYETSPIAADTDGDGLQDGTERGLWMPEGLNAAQSLFKPDTDTRTKTDARLADTDGDKLSDGLEDADKDGALDANETNPLAFDTDNDGLTDGRKWYGSGSEPAYDAADLNWKGEDKNLNGKRDNSTDGNWTETDALANDSDVDGILDGDEVNGTWINATQAPGSCDATCQAGRVLNATNPDFDGDGLRDGQEIAGWRVLVWREGTMEHVKNYTVASDPKVADSDNDQNSDFVEFQNGSDPWWWDTDGDSFRDWWESEHGWNVTGWYNRPPEIAQFYLTKYVKDGVAPLIGSGKWVLNVKAYVVSQDGVGDWEMTLGLPQLNATLKAELGELASNWDFNPLGDSTKRMNEILAKGPIMGETREGNAGNAQTAWIEAEFDLTVAETQWEGVWLDVVVEDRYGLGVSKKEKVKSTLEVIVDILTAIAKAIAEAASAIFNWLSQMVSSILNAIFGPISAGIDSFFRSVAGLISSFLPILAPDAGEGTSPPSDEDLQTNLLRFLEQVLLLYLSWKLVHYVWTAIKFLVFAVEIALTFMIGIGTAIKLLITNFLIPMVEKNLLYVVVGAVVVATETSFAGNLVNILEAEGSVADWLEGVLLGVPAIILLTRGASKLIKYAKQIQDPDGKETTFDRASARFIGTLMSVVLLILSKTYAPKYLKTPESKLIFDIMALSWAAWNYALYQIVLHKPDQRTFKAARELTNSGALFRAEGTLAMFSMLAGAAVLGLKLGDGEYWEGA